MEIIRIRLTDLEQNKGQVAGLPSNPRQWGRGELDNLVKSIQETPELLEARGLIVWPYGGKYIILGGNMRFSALREMNAVDAPCYVLPEDTPMEKLREIVIKDNGAFGSWDYDMLANEWDDLPLSDWGVPAWSTEDIELESVSAKDVQEDDFDEEKDHIVIDNMIEKVNPQHPDKVADRIAGAIVDLAYKKNENPKVAVEVLLGHGECNIIIESSEDFAPKEVRPIVQRIAGDLKLNLVVVPQDKHLAGNQAKQVRCGDNGIFKGVPLTNEEYMLSEIAHALYDEYPYDGKYILDGSRLIICQSHADSKELQSRFDSKVIVNPLGDWTGGPDVDSGATNRKLGSDMAQSVTGGGLHGKDLSKADVSVNIYAFLKAQATGEVQQFCCAIGDDTIDGRPYAEIVEIAREYIQTLGGFEKFAEWGLY